MKVNTRILSAAIFGVGIVAASYFYAPLSTPQVVTDATQAAVAAPAPTRSAIQIKDSDLDGIPDWQEQFRQTIPPELDEFTVDKTATYTPPTTLTGRLAIEMLQGTMQSGIRGPFGPSQEDILGSLEQEVLAAAEDQLYGPSDISMSPDSSLEALRAYGNQVAAIFIGNGIDNDTVMSEIEAIQKVAQVQDPTAQAALELRANTSRTLMDQLQAIRPPERMVNQHLDLLNTYNSVTIDLESMANIDEDALYTIVRMNRYYDDVLMLDAATRNLYTALVELGVRFSPSDITNSFVLIDYDE